MLQALSDAWTTRGDDVAATAANVAEHLRKEASLPAYALTAERIDAAVATLAKEYDALAGGFGEAPKFPPTMVLEFLRRYRGGAEQQARHMLARTVAAMAGSGMYDQVGGGFARYAVDRGWVVPHFEKMLYDNAQLLGLYARLDSELGRRIATETADFMIRELRTTEGGFASALDADSPVEIGGHAEEGAFYAWTPTQLVAVLGPDDGAWAAELFGVTAEGTFEHGTSTLQLRHYPTDPADQERLDNIRRRLLDAREQRPRPARDDKVVAAWNGLAISGLADAGRRLGRTDYLGAAVGAAQLIVSTHLSSTDAGLRLVRVSRDGVPGAHAGVLEDYGCVASGFLALTQATADPRWLQFATGLLDTALDAFRADDGGFHDTAADAEVLVARPRDPGDNASPSGLSAMVHALVEAHALTGVGRYRDAAEAALATASALADQAPRFAGWSLAAATTMLDGPLEVAVVGPNGPERDALEDRALRIPGAVVVATDEELDDRGPIPLLDGRRRVDGRAAAYVCRGFVCERPVTDPDLLG